VTFILIHRKSVAVI